VRVAQAVYQLDAWLDSMRQPGGYGGPVVHWWGDCLEYTGPGLDWRYEGIVIGYLNLWAGSGDERWLAKARQAGDDLVAGQLPSANFRNSQFELNPGSGGTPHEAACDLALLRLGLALQSLGDPAWQVYCQAAERNLQEFYIGRLWDPVAASFRDDPDQPSFVPNKSATLAEAFFAHDRLTGRSQWIERYALPALEAILAHQVLRGDLAGAIYQNSFAGRKVASFFPYYIARCIPALLEAYAWTGDQRFAQAARQAARFILAWQYPDGSFPQVIYPGGRVNRYPQWVAGVGDILRCLMMANPSRQEFDPNTSLDWLLAGMKTDGGLCTAAGFQENAILKRLDGFRDRTSVCGWVDKSFRWLTSILQPKRKQ
jgi:hypothetical protein